MTGSPIEPSIRLVDTHTSEIRFQDALSDLFAQDGTVYIVSGYFTYQGYRAIRDDIVSFLERSRENELILVVSPAADQFSPQIAQELWSLGEDDQVQLYKQPRGLHAKLYIRDGPNPTCIIGSANITQVAFKYNIEVNARIARESIDHPDLEPFHEWMLALVDSSEPLRRRDLYAPFQVVGSVVNWTNKARHLPKRNVALRAVPVLFVVGLISAMFMALFRLIF